MMRVTLGLGCDRGATLETLEDAVREALAVADLGLDAIEAIATIDQKRDEPAILSLARRHGWPVRFFDAATLSKIQVPHPSERVRAHMGTPTVAEGAAILAAAGCVDDLLVEKHRHRGRDGKHATVSIARIRPSHHDQSGRDG